MQMEHNLQTLDQLCFELIDKSKKRNESSNQEATSMLDMMVEGASRSEQGLSAKELCV